MPGLFSADFARHGRLVRIHHSLYDGGPRIGERFTKYWLCLFRMLDGITGGATILGIPGKIDGLQLDAELRSAAEHHLFPFNHAQYVVLDDNDLHRQVVFDQGRDFSHKHGEAAIADNADHLTPRIGDCRANAVR